MNYIWMLPIKIVMTIVVGAIYARLSFIFGWIIMAIWH
jgi:hypothetical protein